METETSLTFGESTIKINKRIIKKKISQMKKINYLTLVIVLSILSIKTISGQPGKLQIYKGITIYIDYPDEPALVTPVQLDSLINGVDYRETGIDRTFRKYWYEQSRRNIILKHNIFFYRAPQTAAYYRTLTWQQGIEMWKGALEWIIANYPDFDWNSLSLVDENFDLSPKGGLLSVMVISSAWGPAGVGAGHGPRWILSNGVKVNTIYCSVLKAPWDIANNMFMTLHESSHGIFGFPDTYDTDDAPNHSGGTSIYCLMSGGKPDVEPLGGPFLAQYNWVNVVEPPAGTKTITMRADGDSVIVLRNIYDPYEFFTIEARKKSTVGNSLFPADLGLLIWHTDGKVNTSNRLSNMTTLWHYMNSIEEADGLFELEYNVQPANIGDIYLPGKSFSNTTIPDTKWWTGSPSNLEVTNIQFVGTEKISFNVTVPDPPARYPIISQTGWSLVSATPSQSGYEGAKAFDGDTNTYYHVPWGNTYPWPHEIVIDMGKAYTINELYYRANTNNLAPWEGRVADYKVYLSDDGVNWGTAIVTGTFFNTWIRQYALFPDRTGRYLKFSGINSFNNDVRTSIAEINLRGTDIISPNAVSDLEQENKILKIYPNPVKDILNIQLSKPQKTFVEIYNSYGMVVKTKTINGSTSMDVSVLSKGIYIIRAKTFQKTEKALFIKN